MAAAGVDAKGKAVFGPGGQPGDHSVDAPALDEGDLGSVRDRSVVRKWAPSSGVQAAAGGGVPTGDLPVGAAGIAREDRE